MRQTDPEPDLGTTEQTRYVQIHKVCAHTIRDYTCLYQTYPMEMNTSKKLIQIWIQYFPYQKAFLNMNKSLNKEQQKCIHHLYKMYFELFHHPQYFQLNFKLLFPFADNVITKG